MAASKCLIFNFERVQWVYAPRDMFCALKKINFVVEIYLDEFNIFLIYFY